MADAALKIEVIAETTVERIKGQMSSRSVRAANELMNAKNLVLRGQRSGRQYNLPNTGRVRYNKRKKTAKITYRKYRASAPGEAPAVRTGQFRLKWDSKAYGIGGASGSTFEAHSQIESNVRTDGGKYLLGEILEEGTGKMAPRPYQEPIVEKAKPRIIKIYKEPYL